jgi:hypothetical protein
MVGKQGGPGAGGRQTDKFTGGFGNLPGKPRKAPVPFGKEADIIARLEAIQNIPQGGGVVCPFGNSYGIKKKRSRTELKPMRKVCSLATKYKCPGKLQPTKKGSRLVVWLGMTSSGFPLPFSVFPGLKISDV